MYLIGIELPTTTPSWITFAVSAIPILLILVGWMLARESKGKTIIEIVAATLLIASSIIPSGIFSSDLMLQLLRNTVQRAPLIVTLVGLAWVRDGGLKILPGAAAVVVGLGLLYGASHL